MTMTKKNQTRIENEDNMISLVDAVAHLPYKIDLHNIQFALIDDKLGDKTRAA